MGGRVGGGSLDRGSGPRDGGHSSRRLQTLHIITLDGETGSVPVRVNDAQHVVWMSIPDLRRRVVPAEVLAWYRFDETLCGALREGSVSPDGITITVDGSEIRSTSASFPLDAGVADALARACAPRGSS